MHSLIHGIHQQCEGGSFLRTPSALSLELQVKGSGDLHFLYFSTVAPKRRDLLIQLIRQYQPKVVMFYSTSGEYVPHWEHIAGSENWEDLVVRERFSAKMFSNGSTTFLITPHPTRQGIRGEDFPLSWRAR